MAIEKLDRLATALGTGIVDIDQFNDHLHAGINEGRHVLRIKHFADNNLAEISQKLQASVAATHLEQILFNLVHILQL